MTGTEGENWPIPAAKFEETYDILSTYDKEPVKGEAAKKIIIEDILKAVPIEK